MEEDIESSGTSMVPLALAILAIVLGGAGLYFGLNASQRLTPLTESIDVGTSSAARLDKQLSTIETRLAEVSAQNDELKQVVERLRVYGSQNEQLTKQVAAAVKSNREELVKLAGKMNELASAQVKLAAPATSSPSATSSAGSTAAAGASAATTADDPSIYKIRAGDNFGKIAAKLNVSLDALLNANSDADPRRLRIGQEINIPAN